MGFNRWWDERTEWIEVSCREAMITAVIVAAYTVWLAVSKQKEQKCKIRENKTEKKKKKLFIIWSYRQNLQSFFFVFFFKKFQKKICGKEKGIQM